MPKSVFRPITPFVAIDPDGVKRHFGPETLVSDGHWVLKDRESLFEPAETAADRIEQATASPGEKRTTRRSSAAKKSD